MENILISKNKKFIGHLIITLLSLIMILSCKNNADDIGIFAKPRTQKLDATIDWLEVHDNGLKTDYDSIFTKYYNLKLKQKDYNNAYLALRSVKVTKIWNSVYDEDFITIIKTFNNKYLNKVTVPTIDLLNEYLGDYYHKKNEYKTAIFYFKKIAAVPPKHYEALNSSAFTYCNLCMCYLAIGDVKAALQYNYKCLEYYKLLKKDEGIGLAYTTFGLIKYSIGDSSSAEKYYNNAIVYFIKDNKPQNAYLTLNDKLTMLYEYDDVRFNALADSVYFAWKKTKLLDNDINCYVTNKYVLSQINQNNLEIAKLKLIEVKKLLIQDFTAFMADDYITTLAVYEIKAKKGISNPKIYLDGIPALIANEDYMGLSYIYTLLRRDALEKKDFKKAYFYNLKEQDALAAIKGIATKKIFFDTETKYNTKQKEQEITLKKLQLEKKQNFIVILITALIAIILGIVIYLLVQNKKKLKKQKQLKTMFTKQLFENTEEERKRIANDLHDGISHELLGLKTATKAGFSDLNLKIDGIINEIRQISRNLHPAMFDRVGLVFSIKQLAEYLEIKNEFVITTDLEYKKCLTPENELQLYRIVQESLNNIIKYAKAHAAKITLKQIDEHLILEIIDNGIGFDVAATLNGKSSFGLHSMIERGTIAGGTVVLSSTENGTTITVKIPIKI